MNPESLVVGALLAVGAWLTFRKPKTGAGECSVDDAALDAWGKADNRIIIRTTYMNPPSLEDAQITWSDVIAAAPDGARMAVITADGRFWEYRNGVPRLAPELKKAYCASR